MTGDDEHMTRRAIIRSVGLAALVLSSASCGSVIRDGSSPVYLVIDNLRATPGMSNAGTFQDNLFSDVVTKNGSFFSDLGRVSMHISVRDIGRQANPPAPTLNNEVTVNRFRVVYRRADGHNTPGVDVPYPFDGTVTGTIPANTIKTLDFELVRNVAKVESPLAELATSLTVLHVIADVTFWGRDQVGNVLSVTGSISIEFANFAD